MRPHRVQTYDDQELAGLALSKDILQLWSTGRYKSLAELTGALDQQHPDIPRSAIFWLSYHVLFADAAEGLEESAGN